MKKLDSRSVAAAVVAVLLSLTVAPVLPASPCEARRGEPSVVARISALFTTIERSILHLVTVLDDLPVPPKP